MPQEFDYDQILRKMSVLRSRGISDTDPRIVKLRAKLKELLDKRRSQRTTKKVPQLTGYNTIVLAGTPAPDKPKANKFMLLGAVLGVIGVTYYYLAPKD